MYFLNGIIYFDNSSTTKPCETAIKYLNDALQNTWGNPSSLHSLGITAEERVACCRNIIADSIGASPEEIYFTGSGTEANNIAVLGAARSLKKRGNRIVTTAIEHPSVIEPIKQLEKEGFEVIYLKPDENGVISKQDISEAVDKNTVLVSIMLVNNEIGSIQPVSAASLAIKKNNAPALLHCDAVQAYGKLPIDINKLGVDLLTASGHKIHAPKGIGFLYKRKGKNIQPIILGGGQEKNLRSGTEGVPLICGLMGAVEELGNIEKNLALQTELFRYAKQKITEQFPHAQINSPDGALPYILNFSVNTHRSETLLHYLDSAGIYVSSGSACAKGHKSYVMSAMGYSDKRIDSALRLSFNRFNTTKEIDKFCATLKSGCDILRKA